MVTGSNDVDEIYNRMAVIRHELHTNVRESVAGAEAVVDWGRHSWTYPWIAVGAAAAVGYLVYTGSHQAGTADAASPADGAKAQGQERSRTGRNLLMAAWGILLPLAVNAGQNYVLQWLEQRYPTRNGGPDRSLAAGRGAGRPEGSAGAAGY